MSELYNNSFYDEQSAGSYKSARILLPPVLGVLRPKSVLDVGCGVGTWLSVVSANGVDDILGQDGAYVDQSRLQIPQSRFCAVDLEHDNIAAAARLLAEKFDLTMSLEVAEHLPEVRAPSFVRELCQTSDAILFSAAIPGQGGTHHVNEQWPSYWCGLFSGAGFECFDVLRQQFWQAEECEWWYLQNIMLYCRNGSPAHEKFAELASPTTSPQGIVHPRCLGHYKRHIDAMNAHIEAVDAHIEALNGRIEILTQQKPEVDAAQVTGKRGWFRRWR